MNTQQAVRPVSLADIIKYKAINPVKFTHKYGEIDFNDLPEGFEAKLSQYKLAVAKERARRELVGMSQDLPAITPWSFFERPKAEKVIAQVEPSNDGPLTTDSVVNAQIS